ncbi:MAG: DUF4339 domain-containing protein [Candidatus Didemnitutus sp.]|nr:DUF4339 domain-containing protein [Candidatus Didemnitutus sp.]
MPPKLSGDDTIGYLVQIDGQLRGPFHLEGLESLAYLGQLTPDSLIRRESEPEFTAIKTTPLLATLFPKYIERTAPAAWGKPGAPATATATAPSRNPLGFGTAKFERVNSAPDVGQKVDVTTMLNEVRQMERDAGLDEVKPERFRVSRRTRDFWIMLIAGNALLLGGGIAMQSLTSLVFAIGGMGLFTFGLLWSMYGVMDRY